MSCPEQSYFATTVNVILEKLVRLLLFFDLPFLIQRRCSSCVKLILKDKTVEGSTLEDIQRAARRGCNSCRILFEGLIQFEDHRPQADHVKDKHVIRVEVRGNIVVVFTRGEKTSGRSYFESYEYLFFRDSQPLVAYKPTNIDHAFLRNCPPCDSTSQKCLEVFKTWLQTCKSIHTHCHPTHTNKGQQFVPTRLLDVWSLRIVDCTQIGSDRCEYVALSHTWGAPDERKKPMPLLLKENLPCRRNAISWEELTATFQDAVIITRRLDVDYIWIDSLCIVQNDDGDWRREAALMSEVYGEAVVVLSATRAKTGDDGIFHQRQIPASVSVAGQGTLSVIKRPSSTHANFFMAHWPDFSKDPLLERAWCFQERILARRVVHFTAQELVWECNEAVWCECQTMPQEAEVRKESLGEKEEFKRGFHELLRSEDKSERLRCWNNIIQGYTTRKLTFESDRLPALSGIAKRIAVVSRGRYIAGVWENDLPYALLWTLQVDLRQKAYRVAGIPSWAWPSVGVAVLPPAEDFMVRSTLVTLAKVLEVTTNLTTEDSFGKVEGGFIVLEAPGLLTQIETDGQQLFKRLVPVDKPSEHDSMIPDTLNDLPENGSQVLCLAIQRDTRATLVTGLLCLVLKRKEKDWVRMGQTNLPTRWLDLTSIWTVKII